MKFWKNLNKNSPENSKTIKETKCVCNVCGKIWHFGKKDESEQKLNKMANAGKALACCGGCIPALLVKDKKITDLNQCPQCNSKNIKCEEVKYEVNK